MWPIRAARHGSWWSSAKAVSDFARVRRLASRLTPARWRRVEQLVAALTLANAALGLVLSVSGFLARGALGSLPLLALLGLLSGVPAWRGRAAGHGAALLFYGVQLAGFHAWHSSQSYSLRGVFSLAFVVHLPAGVLIVNVFAVTMLAASAALLWRRRSPPPLQAP
jgi:hypothetical protein